MNSKSNELKTNKTKNKNKDYSMNSDLIPLFSGTYETIWNAHEYDDNGYEFELDYTTKDLMKSITEAYQENTIAILNDLRGKVDFIENIEFLGTYYSPRQYNFSTDVIDFTLTINWAKLLKTLHKLKKDKLFHKFLKDNFSSYDGFISFTPDNFDDLETEILNDLQESEQSIGAIIQYLTSNDFLHEIEMNIWDYWSGNGYCGLDYKIEK